jgi:glycosyltransferase involved in cell wall biosynthesis
MTDMSSLGVRQDARLTVVLPVYNGMPFLPDALKSILHQTFRDFNVIVVDDGSTDGSAEFLRSVDDPRVLVFNQGNLGPGAARNTGLRHCQSEYVALMDQDDLSLPDRFLYQLEYLDTHPDVVMVGTGVRYLIGNITYGALPIPLDHHGIETRLLKAQSGLCHPSLMFRSEAANAVGGYPTGVLGEDIYFCLRMCEHGRAANLDRVLFLYRLHTNQTVISRYKQLCQDNRYAAHRAICRRMGKPEPSFSSYSVNQSPMTRWRRSVEAWATREYRLSIIDRAERRLVRGYFRLLTTAAAQPRLCLWHLRRLAKDWIIRTN